MQDVVRVENYTKAIDLRNQIMRQEEMREAIDVIYETSRFEKMLQLGEPSEKFQLAAQEIARQEMFAQEQQRRLKEEQ